MKLKKYICGVMFLFFCVLTLLFLNTFMKDKNPYTYIIWEQQNQIAADGTVQPLDPDVFMPDEGVQYVFSAQLGEIPDHALLLFEASNAEIVITLGGTELYRASSVQEDGVAGMNSVQAVLPPDAEGKTLVMEYQYLGGENVIFPPFASVATLTGMDSSLIAYANHYGIPAGALALLFLLVCGLFLLGLSNGKPDFSLLALALAAAVLTANQISISLGYEFLPPAIHTVLTWEGMQFLPPIALLVYLLANRRRTFWKQFGYATLFSAVALLVSYLISLAQGGYLATLVGTMIEELSAGIFSILVYWITVYLTAVCAVISAISVVHSFSNMQAETMLLKLKNSLLDKNYHAIERSVMQTADMRHELRHNITALNLLYQKGDWEGLGHMLDELDTQQSNLVQMQFSDNFVLNTILQNAASDAAEQEIRFEAQALVPAELNIEEKDLCGLIMNMLDNAVEAAQQVSEKSKRFIRFRTELKHGFLAISCTNSCIGNLVREQERMPQSTKADKAIHGYGLKQMNAVAKKYNSIIDITHTEDTFTVQTALQIKKAKK